MIFGNASWGFRETPLERQLEITKNMGLSVLELGIANAPNDLPLDGDPAAVKALYEKYSVALVCAATGNDFTTGGTDDVKKVERVIDLCAELGVKYLRIFAGFSPVGEVCGARWDTMIGCLKQVGAYGAQHGVLPLIETHGGVNAYDDGVEHFYTTSTKPDVLLKMLEMLPENIGMLYDPANLYAVGIKRPDTVYQRIKNRVFCIHMKDFVTLPSGHLKPAACGESKMDWKELLCGIGGCEKIALFEYENTEDVAEGCKRCYDFIKNTIKEN